VLEPDVDMSASHWPPRCPDVGTGRIPRAGEPAAAPIRHPDDDTYPRHMICEPPPRGTANSPTDPATPRIHPTRGTLACRSAAADAATANPRAPPAAAHTATVPGGCPQGAIAAEGLQMAMSARPCPGCSAAPACTADAGLREQDRAEMVKCIWLQRRHRRPTPSLAAPLAARAGEKHPAPRHAAADPRMGRVADHVRHDDWPAVIAEIPKGRTARVGCEAA
jgi:hypothetical protein